MDESFACFVSCSVIDLRNSAVHYSPTKMPISIKPEIWMEQATDFSKTAIDLAKQFWNDCYPNLDDPKYLGRLDYVSHHQQVRSRLFYNK